MPSIVTEDAKAWDFGPVYDLLRNLSSPPPAPLEDDAATKHTTSEAHKGNLDAENARPKAIRVQSQGLGDFSKLWDYLGVDPAAPPPKVRPPSPVKLLRGVHVEEPDTAIEEKDFAEKSSTKPKATIQESSPAKSRRRPKSAQESSSDEKVVTIERNKDYTSDGAVYNEPNKSNVTWMDQKNNIDFQNGETTESEVPGDTGESADDIKDSKASPGKRKQTKEQRRAAKRARKVAKRLAKKEAQAKQPQTKSVSDAEPDLVKSKTPARKASVHPLVPDSATPTPSNRYPLRSKFPKAASVAEFKALTAKPPTSYFPKSAPNGESSAKPPAAIESAAATKVFAAVMSNALPDTPSTPTRSNRNTPAASQKTPQPKVSYAANERLNETPLYSQAANPAFPSYANVYSQNGIRQPVLYPVQSTPPSQHQFNTPFAARFPVQAMPSMIPASEPRKLQQLLPEVPPITIRHGEDRHLHFLLELIKQFPLDKKWLVSPAQLSTHVSTDKGIHVFVDASNIFIGFKEYVRRAFALPYGKQVKGLDISFDSLVLLMERRRPVAKRVLVGSYPNLPAFDMAKAVGYETNILEQVYKDKDLSKKQKSQFYTARDSGFGNGGTLYGGGYANISTPGSNGTKAPEMALPVAPGTPASHPSLAGSLPVQKWVEQGVDEILHLKMLESVVDADEPGTMVLATGDAAVAEYSQGFLKMVERALKKGWSVELMSWREGINRAYLNEKWRAQWGERFRVIDLDGWVEDLVDS